MIAAAPTTTAALAMVAANQLVTLVPRHTSRTMLDALGLTFTAPPIDLQPSPVFLAWHQRYDDDRAHNWLRGIIGTALQQATDANEKLQRSG